VIWKLAFVHDRIRAIDAAKADAERNALRAIIAGLKRPVASPPSAKT